LIPGLLLGIWDGSPTHRAHLVKDYLASGATKRLNLERFPGYAPELNPTEWVWSYLKLTELANITCDHLSKLDALLSKAKKRLQRKPYLIQAFIQNVGYEVKISVQRSVIDRC
jgi:transposase